MLELKPNTRELEFCDTKCGQCNKTIDQGESKEILGDKIQEIENLQMEMRIEKDDKMVKCQCGCIISLEPS